MMFEVNMRLPCQKGCQRRTGRYGKSLAFELANAYGQNTTGTANRVAAPPAMADAYAAMIAKVPTLGVAPTIEFYDSLHGVGGLFIPGEWVIAIGVQDIEEIADRVLANQWSEVAEIATELARSRGLSTADTRRVMIAAGLGRCIAHELGHALIQRGWYHPFGRDAEAGADYFAGKLDAARGNDARLGELFFREIGCTGASCDHPSPDGRATAYLTGYVEQQRAA